MKLKATKQYHSTPVSPRLASNFIELGYGLQVEGMASEMFFNRSFEPFYPYRMINKLWYDLLEDENDLGSRCETDWRVFDWYHSSYEHNAWFAFPAVAGYQEIKDDSTFIISDSANGKVHIELTEDPHHGTHAMKVANNSESGEAGGLAQDGKYCFEGVRYVFSGDVRNVSGSGKLKAALFRESTVSDPVCVCELTSASGEYAAVRAELKVPETGRYTFVLLTAPGSVNVCDNFSLKPSDEIRGFKKSAVEAGKYVSPKVVRWPGGCFASFYDWRKGVGSVRVPSYSYFWGGYQYNDIGTDELASYAEAIGGESMICVNMHHPFKRCYDVVHPKYYGCDPGEFSFDPGRHGRDLPQFADKDEGAAEAAAWVEYCNGDVTTKGGAARSANGRTEPYNVRYWEMDNEVHRWFSPEEYALECVKYSKAMKAVDPSVKIGMAAYCYDRGLLGKMIEIAGADIDFLADRGIEESDLEFKLDLISKYNSAHGTDIKYCNTEWLPLNGADVDNMVPKPDSRKNKCFMFSKWSYGLDAAAEMMMWQRHGGAIDFINFNNLANTHAQSVIETPKEGAFVTAPGMIMHMFAVTKAYRTLVLDDYHPERTDPVQVQLSVNKEGDALVLNVLNRSESDGFLELDISLFDVADGQYSGTVLSGDSLLSMNRLGDAQVKESPASIAVRGRMIRLDVRKLTYSEYVIPVVTSEIAR